MGIIYKTTNLINGKFYIGKDSKNNPSYFGSGLLLKRAIEKYGIENFKKETLEVCETVEELNEREIFWINETDAKNIGYNIASGGHGGNTYNEEISKRVSEMFKGREVSQETIDKIQQTRRKRLEENPNIYDISKEHRKILSNTHSGKQISEEHKNALRDGAKKYHESKNGDYSNLKGKCGLHMKGKHHSEETKQKMSSSHKKNPNKYWEGKVRPIESIEKFKSTMSNKTPEEKLEKYVNWYYGRFNEYPTEKQKQQKYEKYLSEIKK